MPRIRSCSYSAGNKRSACPRIFACLHVSPSIEPLSLPLWSLSLWTLTVWAFDIYLPCWLPWKVAPDLSTSCIFQLTLVWSSPQLCLLLVCLRPLLSSPQHSTQGPSLKHKGASKIYYKVETTLKAAIFTESLVAVVLAGKEVEIKSLLERVAERQNLVSAVISCMTLDDSVKLSELQFPSL